MLAGVKARVIAWSAVGAAAAFAAAAPFWDSIEWELPPPIEFSQRWSWFSLYPWLALALTATGVFALSMTLARRAAIARRALLLGAMIGAVILYLPFFRLTVYRVDRIRGTVEEPARAWRLLGAAFVVAIAAHALFLGVTSLRHTPPFTRRLASVALVVTCGVYLHLFWLMMVVPITDEWAPADWDRPDLLRPFRPCRGASLWDGHIKLGRIDNLWTSFRDPRAVEHPVPAISFAGSFREGYYWLTLPEAAQFRVRADDPAIVNCDARWRRDPVAPAAWHKLGAREGGRYVYP